MKIDINLSDYYCRSALIYALMKKYPEDIIKLLINKKTNINQKDENYKSPLIYALENTYPEKIIKLLINEKTNFNQKDKDDYSPIYFLLKGYCVIDIKKIFCLFKKIYLNLNTLLDYTLENKNKLELILRLLPYLNKKDFFNWNFRYYFYWKQKRSNINYLLIFSN